MNREISSTDRPVDRLARWSALDPIADRIQPLMAAWLDASGDRAWIKDLLHGTTLKHPLHPALTDVPIGAWTMTAVFDTLELGGSERFTPAADLAVGVGIVGALAAVATGYAEWSDTHEEPKRLGMAHAMLNAAALTSYLASLVARIRGDRGVGIATGFAGFALVSAGAYLGGELASGYGIGSKHVVQPTNPPDDFTAVMALADLGSETTPADFAGIPVLLTRFGDEVTAIAATCTHRGANLAEGEFADGCVTCPWHGARFRVGDGSVVEGPAVFPLARFETRVRDGKIELKAIV